MGGCLSSKSERVDANRQGQGQTDPSPQANPTHPVSPMQQDFNANLHSAEPPRRSPSQILSERGANRLENVQEISQALTDLERERAMNIPEEDRQPEPGQGQEQVIVLDRNGLLFLLYQSILRQDMQQADNIILLLRILDLLNAEPGEQGLSEEELARVEHVRISQPDKACAVCQESLDVGVRAIQLNCKHEYHEECITPWLQKSDKCPMCRTSARVGS